MENYQAQNQYRPGAFQKGHLKIFFGYAAGVGKTYAMLEAAHQTQNRGIDVVVGYIERHTRPDTLALLEGLEQLPEKIVEYKGISLKELDLDAALQRRPNILLVDELAHSNAAGCRHSKRYQDVEELLRAGISVYTTVNVQHLESLNDLVASITHIAVSERMEEMHYFKESQREEIPVPDFKDNITRKLLLQFLCNLCTWAQATPVTSVGIKKDAHSLYILFRNFAFSEQDFWQTFGGYLIALRPKWKIGIFGTELSSQETVALLLDQQNWKFYAVQKTISGRYADSIRSLCLRIECANTEDAAMVNLLCQHMDWQSGILVADWDLREAFEREYIPWLHQSTCYCYGNLSEDQEQQDYLDVLSFPQKVGLWLQFLENRFDYEEFAWLYDRISAQELNDRIEWELAVYAALNQLEYALKISKSEFELYDGSGERRYFSFNSEQNAQRVFLKLLFPLNV